MPLSIIAHVGSGCRNVGPEVLAAVAPARLNASWFTRFNCRFAVLRGHVRLHCGLGGLHEGVAVCPGGQGDTGPLFHSGRFLFYGPSHLRQFGCQRFGPVVLLLQRLPQYRRRAVDRLLNWSASPSRIDNSFPTYRHAFTSSASSASALSCSC